MPDTYERKLSSEEAGEGYIMVLKDRLAFFPAIGETFQLGGVSAKVEARHCECRGPEKPHEHYFIRRAGLNKGQKVRIARNGSNYTLAVE